MVAAGGKSQRKIDEVSSGVKLVAVWCNDSIVIGGLQLLNQIATPATPLSPLDCETRVRSSNLSGPPFFSSLHDGVRRPPALTIGRLVSKPLAAKDEPQLARVFEGAGVVAVQQSAETSVPATCDLPDPTKVEPMRLPRTLGTAAFLPDTQVRKRWARDKQGRRM